MVASTRLGRGRLLLFREKNPFKKKMAAKYPVQNLSALRFAKNRLEVRVHWVGSEIYTWEPAWKIQEDLPQLYTSLVKTSHLYLRRSSIHGVGLYTRKKLKPGTSLGMYYGKVLREKDVLVSTSRYILQLRSRPSWISFPEWSLGGIYIDAEFSNCFLRYCNDARGTVNPNTFITSSGEFITSETIEKDQEILVSYGEFYWKPHEISY